MKKIFALCMSAALLLQTCPVAFAASAKAPITVQAIATEQIWNDLPIENSAGSEVSVKYETIEAAMEDLSDGVVTDADGSVCKLDGAKPCKIYIAGTSSSPVYEETISDKIIISADSVEAAGTTEVSDSEITLHFQEVKIAVKSAPKKNNTITFSGGLEVQSGASLILDNNTEDKKGASITYSFGAPVTVSGSLKFEGNSAQLGSSGGTEGSVSFTDGANLTVENGGEVTAASVAITGSDTTSPLLVVKEGGKLDFVTAGASSYGTIQTSGTAIQVDGGDVTIGAGKITSNNGSAVVANSGDVTVEKGGNKDVTTPEISSTGASSIAVGNGAELTVSGGKVTGSNGQPAIDAANGATVVIPEGSSAKIESTGEGSDNNAAITLAPGANIQKGETNVTVGGSEDGDPASNYMDNHGNIVLQSGSADGKVTPNTVITPDGTAISGKDNLPTVEDNGSVTLPQGGATITNPEGDKVDVGNGAEIPSIVIGVKDAETGKVEDSTRIELNSGALTLETAVFDSEIDLKDYTCTVASDKEPVATAELKDGKIVVTPVSTGTAKITATYTKNNGAAEGIALLDEGEATAENDLTATFTVEVYKESSGGGGGGGSSSSTTYAVSVEDSKNGSVSVSPKRAEKGDTVTITVKPDTGYELDELTVTDKNGDKIKLTEKDDNKFTFKMPGSKVTVETSFKLIETEPENPFTDISKNDYFYDAVLWAADKGITSGVTDTLFAPNASCTRAQMVTFLWRANGSPVVDYAMNFTDVPADAYYADAVRWAVSKGITSGTSATTFAPDMTVTRAQTVTFLYRAAGTPAVSGGSFADVDANAYYADAVAWAVAEGITSGTSATTFSPDAACTRGQIVTFLYRDAQ